MYSTKFLWRPTPVLVAGLLSACVTAPPDGGEQAAVAAAVAGGDPDKMLIVDCLLPGQIRKLGSQLTYLTPRRPVKTAASDCEIRGGEYVAYDRADYRTALRVWMPQAEAGDAVAQTYVGEIYERGLGVPPDYGQAAQWYRKAAEQDYSRAQINLGALYEQGLGVEQDQVTALNWYRKASGLTGDEVAFTSSFAAERDELRQEVALRQQEADVLRQQLAQTEEQLQVRRQNLEAAQQQLAARQQQLQQQRQAASTAAAPVATTAEATEDLENQIEQQQALIEQQNQELAYLQQQAERQQAQLRTELRAAERRAEGLEEDVAFQERERESLQQQVDYLQAQLVRYQERLNGRKEVLQDQQLELEETQKRLALQQQDLASQNQNQEQIERLRQQLNAKNQQLAQTQQQIIRLQTDVQNRQSELAKLRALRMEQTPAVGLAAQPALVRRSGSAPAAEANPTVAPASLPALDFGRYHALVIGNNQYAEFPDLETAINDARAMADLLKKRYGFETRVLTDASRYEILSALNEFRSNLTEKDNFLLYYAGHGELDKANARGHWLPVDAEPTSTANWISNVQVTDILNTMNAKHIMVIADSCYSGTLARSVTTSIEGGRSDEKRVSWLKIMINTPSRTVLTSGGLNPVLDSGGGGQHSIFANVLLEVLDQNADVLEGPLLYRQVSKRVETAASELGQQQEPLYAPMKYAGDLGAPFFFVPVTSTANYSLSQAR